MLNEQIATSVGPSCVSIAYERRGAPGHPAVLLVMGIAAQMIHWPEEFLQALVGRQLQVIRFDNRDSGHSTHFANAPVPNLPAVLAGDLSSAGYTLSDMAADAVGLLDALGLDAAHVVGASMGGAIAQTMAIEFPERVLSLTSMMSTTGSPAVGQPHPRTLAAIYEGRPATTRQDAIDRALRLREVIGSPAYPADPEAVADRAGRAYDRGFDDAALARQAVACVASGDRTPQLRTLRLPALVIHGDQDSMCDVSGGRATAGAIPGAELVLVEGMGHDLPAGIWEPIAKHIARIVERGESRIANR